MSGDARRQAGRAFACWRRRRRHTHQAVPLAEARWCSTGRPMADVISPGALGPLCHLAALLQRHVGWNSDRGKRLGLQMQCTIPQEDANLLPRHLRVTSGRPAPLKLKGTLEHLLADSPRPPSTRAASRRRGGKHVLMHLSRLASSERPFQFPFGPRVGGDLANAGRMDSNWLCDQLLECR